MKLVVIATGRPGQDRGGAHRWGSGFPFMPRLAACKGVEDDDDRKVGERLPEGP